MLADVANEVLMLGAGGDERTLTTMTNPRVRRRERHGAGLKAATASTAAVKPEGKPALAKTLQASAPTKVKEDAKPVQPAPEASEKATSAPAKKAAPLPKRGASSGIMQAFSKASTKAKATAKPAAKTSQPATPSGNDNSSMQALSDDGEDDEEMPQPKPRGASGSKSRKQREEELRQMMEEDDEEEEASERDDMSQEEPMEEEPAAPEPVQEETEVVTASTNGRRRGKRRVMRKKQIMDDQGYLGKWPDKLFDQFIDLTRCHSYHPGAWLGVLFGGRGSSARQGGEDDELGAPRTGGETQAGWPERESGKHHVLLFQKVT